MHAYLQVHGEVNAPAAQQGLYVESMGACVERHCPSSSEQTRSFLYCSNSSTHEFNTAKKAIENKTEILQDGGT